MLCMSPVSTPFSLGSFFDPEDRGDIALRNIA
jgi:hypothetical protein